MGRRTYDSNSVSCFPEGFKMVLPDEYRIDTEYDDNWNEVIHLRGGFRYDEYGEEVFDFTCTFITLQSELADRDRYVREGKLEKQFKPGLMLDLVADSVMEAQQENLGPGIRVNISKTYPASTAFELQNSVSFFGIPVETHVVFYLIEINENLTFGFSTGYQDDPSTFYKRLLDVIKSIQVKGKSINIGNITPKKLERVLNGEYGSDTRNLDIGLETGSSGTKKKKNSEKISNATPAETLYPHYNSKLNIQGLGSMGFNVVTNQGGTEYQFYNLLEDLSEDAEDAMRQAVSELSDIGASSYKLAGKAEEMRRVFRVSKEIFDPEHDKECELAEGMMRKAYMMSALRSFAWTLAKYCKSQKIKPNELKLEQIRKIIEAVADKEWLNYDDKSVCKGLCGTQDLHVYYLPDKTPESVKAVFKPSQEEIDQTKQIQEKIPNYNPILSQIGSLEGLRKDLKYIYPSIKLIYEDLKKNRTDDTPLEGNDADILYAWCALAYAARGPFFSEDGPMRCFFTQIESGEGKAVKKKESSKRKMSEGTTPDRSAQSKNNMAVWGFKAAEVPAKRQKLIDSNNGYTIRFLPHSAIQKNWKQDMMAFRYYCSLHCPEFASNVNSIMEHAEKYSKRITPDGASVDLKAGKLKNSAPIHALRSFIWTAAEMQDGKVKKSFPGDAPEEMWVDLAAFIRMHGYANYASVDKKTKRFGAALLRKEEVRSVYTDACGFSNNLWSYQGASIGKTMSKASISSLFQVVEVLLQTMPVMELYYNNLGKDDNQTDIAEAMRTILSGWLVFAFACGQPFFIVPGEYCTEDVDLSSLSDWTKSPELSEAGDGKFTLCGTEIIGAKDCGKEVMIPEGVTGIIVNEDTIPGLQDAFKETEKIVYPRSYAGAIVIPPNVKDIDVLGDSETIMTVCLSEKKDSLRSLNFLGKSKSVGTNAFYGLNNLKTIALPEGVGTLYTEAFFGWNNEAGELFLPESLTSLEGKVFNAYSIDEDVTIKVYKHCPAKETIKAQLDEHKSFWEEREREFPGSSFNRKYNIKLIELESPWDIRAQAFISILDSLYDEAKPNVSPSMVKEMLGESIGSFDDYLKCKSFIISNAREAKRSHLVDLVENSTDDQKSYESLPEALAEDINKQIGNRLREERKKKLEEIKWLSQCNSIDDLNKAIEMLEELKKDGMDADPIIEQLLKKIDSIKAVKYREAENLAAERNVPSISDALALMKSISPYRDSSDKIKEYDGLLRVEKGYGTALVVMQRTDPQSIKNARRMFEGFRTYKNSVSKAQECSIIIDKMIKENNEKAKALLADENDGSLGKAQDVYKFLASFDEDQERLKEYESNITSIDEIIKHKDTLKRLKAEHATLGGFFKKKKRLEVEEKIRQVESKIDEIKCTLK